MVKSGYCNSWELSGSRLGVGVKLTPIANFLHHKTDSLLGMVSLLGLGSLPGLVHSRRVPGPSGSGLRNCSYPVKSMAQHKPRPTPQPKEHKIMVKHDILGCLATSSGECTEYADRLSRGCHLIQIFHCHSMRFFC